jgi:sterol desaturase/sphingolipid hydroxylase (fatty acid hydroxylase superfamily)
MEAYAKTLLVAMPLFLVFVLFEKFYGIKKAKDTVPMIDMISSLSSGVTHAVKEVMGLTLVLVSYSWLVEKIALTHIQNTFLIYVVAFIAIDFAGYWVHRWCHEINLLWNLHVIHHSSEEFNLACALRQPISTLVNPFSFVLIPAALVGVPFQVIATIAPLHLFAQFWYHTRHIGKLGFLEKIIVTPSQHRVHHAINNEYLDKNYSQIFVIWDKIFGSFQEELTSTAPVYGITRPAHTWNPVKINFQHLWLMLKDSFRTKNKKDKFLLWFRKTGYRPSDAERSFPVSKINNVHRFEKYGPELPQFLQIWSAVQLGVVLLSVSGFLFYYRVIHELTSWGLYSCGLFVLVSVFAMTDLMDRSRTAHFWELLRAFGGIFLVFTSAIWLGKISFVLSLVLITYLLISFLVSLNFTRDVSVVVVLESKKKLG